MKLKTVTINYSMKTYYKVTTKQTDKNITFESKKCSVIMVNLCWRASIFPHGQQSSEHAVWTTSTRLAQSAIH